MHTAFDVKRLVNKLNNYRNAYYNNDENIISDKEYDDLFDELVELEKETGIVLSNSPTVTVGYPVVSDLPEVKHEFPPLLSLDKSKSIEDMHRFIQAKDSVVMAKMDGLTCRITYRDGKLYRAETRGDGYTGEDITHNIRVVEDVPLTIDVTDEVVIDGEVIVNKHEFEKLRKKFVDKNGKTYKNARNFASGSIRLHDSAKAAERKLEFVAWKFTKGCNETEFTSRLDAMSKLGFTVTPYSHILPGASVSDIQTAVDMIEELCITSGDPIDGCVFSYNDCEYMESLGYTTHHSRAQKAFKFYDEKYDTIIRDIDWTMGKTGVLTPTAIFDTVEIDGTEVSRASLHNLTIMKELNVRKNSSARVFKANMIIPQVDSVDDDGESDFSIPVSCPICCGRTKVICENESEVLMCLNPGCTGKLLGKLCTFVSKQGMNIDGLGENNLLQFLELNLIKSFKDVYNLDQYKEYLMTLDGMGESSVNKLLAAIDRSRNSKLENFLAALSIPNIGLTSAKTISKYFNGSEKELIDAVRKGFNWSTIEGFGEKTAQAITSWFDQYLTEVEELLEIINIENSETSHTTIDSLISGKTFCITGTFWESRSELEKILTSLGGTLVSGVTKKTDILFVGQKAGSKLKKAQDLGILIYDEQATQNLLKLYGF